MSSEPQLLLHTGYPKSGTTTLQAGVYPRCDHIFLAGKSAAGKRETITPEANQFRTLVNYGTDFHIERARDTVIADLDALWEASGKSTMLMSLEGLTNPFVDTHYAQPRDLFTKARNIAHVLEPILKRGIKLKLLVTVRAHSALIPSLFSQIYLHGFISGLYEPTYDGFLDFMFDDELAGFGPDFYYDRYLDHLCDLFGRENIHVAEMKSLLSGDPTPAADQVASFLNIDTATCCDLIATTPSRNVRKSDKGRRMMVKSGGINRFERTTGFKVRPQALRLQDRIRLRRGKPVIWQLPDRTERINAYYEASATRLAEKYGVTL